VVFCTLRENQDNAAALWRAWGYDFAEYDLPEVGLRVLLDWNGGIEIISPTTTGPAAAQVFAFLETHGEGVYSVVARTGNVDGAITIAKRHGARVALRQQRDGEGYELDEAMLTVLYGMPITVLATDLPD
jgi:4-hydroxyphenylpyruvate dioxygenase-like putative hemolysin